MGKAGGFLTPKAISNRIKAKGLQKLRWYCQPCQKQCRDQNGFKCHLTSESHMRQMRIVQQNQGRVIHQFSEQFESDFCRHLSHRFGTRRVMANVVYNEFIQDKNHLHMNATQWTSLTQFIQYLGQSGKCIVDETEKGWFIQWIERDPEKAARQEAMLRKEAMELGDADRERKRMEELATKAHEEAEAAGVAVENEFTEVDHAASLAPITISFTKPAAAPAGVALAAAAAPVVSQSVAAVFGSKAVKRKEVGDDGPAAAAATGVAQGSAAVGGPGKKLSALEEIMKEEEERRAREWKRAKKDYWLAIGIVVKIMNKKLAEGKYYKQKGVVVKLVDKYTAEVEEFESGDVLRLDQNDLETVIPKVGGTVLLVNGPHVGCRAVLTSIDIDRYCASMLLQSGPDSGTSLNSVPYEDFSKLHEV